MNLRDCILLFVILTLFVCVVMSNYRERRVNGELSYLRTENIKLQNQVGFLEAENFNLREALEEEQ